MRSSLPAFLAKRLTALVATVVVAPTVAYAIFNGLSGSTGGEALPAFAWDYAVTTFWHLDLGESSTYQLPVATVVWQALPADMAMVIGGIGCGVALGLLGGMLCALRPGTWIARAAHTAMLFVLSSPPYWLGFLVLIFFAPDTGYVLKIPLVSDVGEYVSLTANPLHWLKSLWMPWLMVGLPLAAAVMRMTESALRDAMGEEFLRTARAKGLGDVQVLRRHALPLAIAPVAALTGANVALVITNVALMESAFNIPGIYREISHIASFRDFPLLQGMIIETTMVIVVANMLADLVQARLDPRIR